MVNQGIEVQEVTSFGPVEQGEDLARREFFGGYRGGRCSQLVTEPQTLVGIAGSFVGGARPVPLQHLGRLPSGEALQIAF